LITFVLFGLTSLSITGEKCSDALGNRSVERGDLVDGLERKCRTESQSMAAWHRGGESQCGDGTPLGSGERQATAKTQEDEGAFLDCNGVE
jgi:hypothetical protein